MRHLILLALAAACGPTETTTGIAADLGALPDCGQAAWTGYGADGQRTGTTDACVTGPLAAVWRYEPADEAIAVHEAVADANGPYVQWARPAEELTGTTAIDALDASGGLRWAWDSHTDANLGNWPTLGDGRLFVQDDGLYGLDAASGGLVARTGVDRWGQTLLDGDRLLAVNTSHVDGPRTFVGGFDSGGFGELWKQNVYGDCRLDLADETGGLALDGDSVFYAPRYSAGTIAAPFASGVYAFSSADGSPRWSVETTPSSAVSAGNGLLYLAENDGQLVARDEATGELAWSADVPRIGAQAPVLLGPLVVVGTSEGVSAFDATTGQPYWTTTLPGVVVPRPTVSFDGACHGAIAQSGTGGAGFWSTIAGAAGSGTLVVTADDGVHVLDAASGHDLWNGDLADDGRVHDPIVVGERVYVVDGRGLVALDPQ